MYSIAVIPGDGIGPEVTREAFKVLDRVAAIRGFQYEAKHYPWSSQYYLDTGKLMGPEHLDEMRQHQAIFLGAIGDPRVETGLLEKSVIFNLRFGLDLYVNLRPVVLYAEHLCPLKDKGPEDVDLVVVRENTEDAYAGVGGNFKKGTPDEVAICEMIFTRRGVERIIRYAFELARARNKEKKLTLVDKANALRAQDIWTRVFAEVGQEYPDIEQNHAYIDAACMWMVKNPEWFDVIVTTNLFGDIITDLGAMVQGGMGLAASGNMHPGQVSMFEPIHGSAPKYAGQNVANPMGAINAVAMMLDYLGEKDAGALIEGSVRELLASRQVPSLSAGSGLSTSAIGDLVVAEVERRAAQPAR